MIERPTMTLLRAAGRFASRGRAGRRLAILFYHRVLERPDPMYPEVPDAGVFARHMEALRSSFNVVDLADGIAMLAEGKLPPGAVAVTLDDGFADNYHVALPILRRQRLTATVFVATDYLDGGCMFNDAVIEACRHAPLDGWRTGIDGIGEVRIGAETRRATVSFELLRKIRYLDPALRDEYAARLLRAAGARPPVGLMLTGEQVVEMHRAGIGIGAHTASHPILARLDAAAAEHEIVSGRDALVGLTAAPVRLFAYPNGKPGIDFTSRDVGAVRRAGFEGAVTTAWGVPDRSAGRWELPRIGCRGVTPARFALRLLWYFLQGAGTAEAFDEQGGSVAEA